MLKTRRDPFEGPFMTPHNNEPDSVLTLMTAHRRDLRSGMARMQNRYGDEKDAPLKGNEFDSLPYMYLTAL
ncbi:hypothetical protein EsDP_00001766 [Epichloe bromicola]|uniref:Uncharacterized protein n=1 Tax=Epichloe bromicola TaxID=79588 RepID=A0ABQ0CIT1_9HYPO